MLGWYADDCLPNVTAYDWNAHSQAQYRYSVSHEALETKGFHNANFLPLVAQNFVAMTLVIINSIDYVYGMWVYKILGIWKGYYRVKKSLVSCMKLWTEARNNRYMKYHSKLTYQLSFWNVSRKVDYHAGGKWFIHGPKRHKENQLLSLKHPCWLSLV